MRKAKIAVVGAGLMGHGIAQVFALAGHDVTITDSHEPNLDTVEAAHRDEPARSGRRRKSRRARHAGGRYGRLRARRRLCCRGGARGHAAQAEAVRRDRGHVRPDTILASNTSVMPITEIMQGLKHRARALGTHWWNPPFLVPLVEVIGTQWTSPRRDRLHHEAARRCGEEAGACEEGRAGLHRQPAAACAVARGGVAGRERHLRRRDGRCGHQGIVRPPARGARPAGERRPGGHRSVSCHPPDRAAGDRQPARARRPISKSW